MFNSIEEVIADIQAGKMVILVDDEDRENEGDFVIAGECVTPEAINFMVRYGRGLVCMPITEEKCQALNLGLMVPGTHGNHLHTNFTVSIEAASGVTTGISASDRATTIQAAVAKDAKAEDIVQPGHIFPIVAQKGGVLKRAGHTEASTDLAYLAGFEPAGVIVEILNEDGTMARRPDLEKIAELHGLKIGTIADLIKYRIETEVTVEKISSHPINTVHGAFYVHSYLDVIDDQVHFAFVKGNPAEHDATYIRVHHQDDLGDLFEIIDMQKSWTLADSLAFINQKTHGVVILLANSESSKELHSRLQAYINGSEAIQDREVKTIGAGARILQDLGVSKMRVLGSKKKYIALAGFGLEVVEHIH